MVTNARVAVVGGSVGGLTAALGADPAVSPLLGGDELRPLGSAGLSFAWAGGAEPGVPHYYRVQGPRLLIEYDNAQRAGNHAHSVWRDPVGDFGMDFLGEHHLQGARRPSGKPSGRLP
jgi:hypothetical protein